MLAHTKGREGNLLFGTQIQCLMMRITSMGHQMRQLLATLCVASSLALGVSDLSSGFHL
jgi:hypothetical protein